jgi:hypothetical protein
MKAFPNVFLDYIPKEEYRGMDLRDYFAAKAMQGLLSTIKNTEEWDYDDVAAIAYGMADMMMEAREK